MMSMMHKCHVPSRPPPASNVRVSHRWGMPCRPLRRRWRRSCCPSPCRPRSRWSDGSGRPCLSCPPARRVPLRETTRHQPRALLAAWHSRVQPGSYCDGRPAMCNGLLTIIQLVVCRVMSPHSRFAPVNHDCCYYHRLEFFQFISYSLSLQSLTKIILKTRPGLRNFPIYQLLFLPCSF